MYLIEIVLQGVRRFTKSRKFPLKPGLNVIYGPTESGKTTLVECVLDLLYPDRIKEQDIAMVSSGEVQASRAGLTIGFGRDVYRVLKDFQSNQISLTLYNPASQKFEPLASDPAQIASTMASSFELPPFDVFSRLFTAAAESMPSHLPLNPGESAPGQERPAQQPGQQPSPQGPLQQPSQPGVPPGMLSGPGIPGMMSGPGMPAPGAPGQQMPGQQMPGMFPGQQMPGVMPAPGMTGMPGMGPGAFPDDGMTPAEREEKLGKLREELSSAEKIEKIQFEIDGLQQRVFEIESKIKSTEQFDEFMEAAEEQMNRYPGLKRLPQNIDERVDRYKDLHAIQAGEIEQIDQEALEYDDDLKVISTYPKLWNQTLFRAGAAGFIGGIVLFVAAPYLGLGFLKLISALASLGGVVAVVVSAFTHMNRTGHKDEIEGKLSELEERKQGVIRRFEVEMAVIEKLMNDTDSDSIEELKNKIEKFRDLTERYRSVRSKKEKVVRDLDVDKLKKEQDELNKKIDKLEEQLRSYPPMSMDVNSIRKEIKGLEDVIRATNPGSSLVQGPQPSQQPRGEGLDVPDFASGAQEGGATQVMDEGVTKSLERKAGGPVTAAEVFEQMLQTGAKLFQIDRNKLVRHVQERLNLYTQAFFAKRYVEMRIELDGSVALRDAESKRWTEFESMSPAARDTAFMALQITLLELAVQKKSLPVILDNPLARLDETATIVAAKALKRVGERSQVVLLCSQSAPAKFADNAIELA